MIIGDRLRLRAIEREDVPTFVRWFNDPRVRRYLNVYLPMSTMDEQRWVETLPERKDDLVLAIEAQSGDDWFHIGNLGLHGIDRRCRVAAYGIVIGEKDYWGRGYGTDATRLFLAYCFDELNLHRVELEVFIFNARARSCYEKAGFKHEGIRRQAHYTEGEYHDSYMMSILADEYREKRAEPEDPGATKRKAAPPAPR